MKILHIYKDYYPVLGGMENHIRMLAEAQGGSGHDVTVLVTGRTGKTSSETMNGVKVIRAGRLATIASTPISVALPLILRKERPDIAHLHFPYPVGEVSHLLFGKPRRTVVTYHSDVVRQKGYLKLYGPIMKRFLRKADVIIATSENYIGTSPYLKPLKDMCRVIPLGIDLIPFLNIDRERVYAIRAKFGGPLILFVGKLRYYKGLQYLLEAMNRIPARLLVVGDGPMESRWRAYAAECALGDKVTFLGELGDDEIPPYYQAADIFVLPASERSEAFGLVQVEAMASGLPVVSTELGTGTSFVNRHGETGLVVMPRNPEMLADAIRTLLDDEGLRKAMGARGRARALSEFSLDRMVRQVDDLYRSILPVDFSMKPQ